MEPAQLTAETVGAGGLITAVDHGRQGCESIRARNVDMTERLGQFLSLVPRVLPLSQDRTRDKESER
ncbi:hypothetical protein SBRY_100227 [Actinacidiphila bryophytorum]|uniref:Uncharacterized protein n=1 Tax=Actinacidiphila bryophytorum TaxID=1436133 RepID=A0A9W4E2E2_9ACTN|nr:hypothetical protein SBRY_100227 [Actinacidiphila bryophytorum]